MTVLAEKELDLELERIPLPSAEWDEFVASHPHHMFQKSLWGLILQEGYHIKTAYYALRKNKVLVLGLPGVIFDFKIVKLFHGSTPYGGFVGDYRFIPEFIKRFPAVLKKENIDFLRITRNYQQNFELPEFKIAEGCQHFIGFAGRTPEQIWEQHEKNARQNVRKARREGLEIRPLRGPEDIALYYEMYVLAMKRSNALRAHTRRLYEVIYEKIMVEKQGTILFAEYQGRTVAGILLLFDQDKVYFLGSAFCPEVQFLRPNDFLMEAAIRYSQENGFAIFDFMTTSAKEKGIIQYKDKWGSVNQPFLIYEKNLNGLKGRIWTWLWKLANTSLGTALIDGFRKKYDKMRSVKG